MNLDPRSLLGEELAYLCVDRTSTEGSAQERAADRLGAWIKQLSNGETVVNRSLLTDRMRISDVKESSGQISFGGSTRLIRCVDGYAAVPLARDTDIEMLPAFFKSAIDSESLADRNWLWNEIEVRLATITKAEIQERAELLGIPIAVMGEVAAPTLEAPAIRVTRFRDTAIAPAPTLKVLELASMWAGPLAGKILAMSGADVTKVESPSRPDGLRAGSPAFFEYLNAEKTIVPVDFTHPRASAQILELVLASDVIIEGSRPRALEQLGVYPRELLEMGKTKIWVSLTGYGRHSSRVAFGDDAAVAGALCDVQTPAFTGDASGDPLTGMAVAVSVLAAARRDNSYLLDASMARVCAWAATARR